MTPANDNVELERTDISGDGPWKDASLDLIKREFVAFHKASAFPERFKGVALNVRPLPDRSFRIVCAFSVSEQKRDGQRAPCNVCLSFSKFVSNGRLIVDANGWLFFVGPDCAEDYFSGGAYVRGERAFRSREESDRAIEFLLEAIPQVPRWISLANRLQPFVDEADDAHRKLHKTSLSFINKVRLAHVEGALTVDHAQEVRPANGKPYVRRVRRAVSRITGILVLQDACDLARDLEIGRGQLELFLLKSDDEIVNLLAEFERVDKIIRARAMLGSAIGHIERARDRLLQHRAFYTPTNFDALGRWNLESGNSRQYEIESRGNTRTIREVGAGRFWANFQTLLGAIPKFDEP